MVMFGGDRDDFRELTEKLGDLVHLDSDAVEAYNEAIEKSDDQEVRSQLSQFRDDHQRHITQLQQLIAQMGGTAPEQRKDIKGFLVEGMTALRSSMGTEQAMKAMRQNEVLTNRGYKDAIEEHTWPSEAMTILQSNYSDEQRHLEWIERWLSVGAGTGGTTREGGTYRTDY